MNSTDLHDRSLTPTLPLSHSLPNERSSPAEGEGAGAHADRFIVRAGDELDALRNLPIEGLRLEQDTIDALHEVNIAHIGELTCLDRNDLAARFGRDLLLKLDRALGDQGGADEPIEPQRLIQAPRVERVFDGPVKQAEGIARTVQDLVAELCGVLLKIESGVRQLDIDFERIDAANLHEMIMLSRPSRDAKHLWSLLRPRVEKANLGYGVEKIVLKATRTGRLPHAQVERWTDDDANGAAIKQVAGELIDTLTNRLGSERITRAVLIESHLPERAFRHEPVAADTQRPTISNQQPMVDRPTVLLEKPELIEVMSLAPAGPPQWLRWRSQELAIITSSGPERIGEEWWREGAVLPSCQRREMFDAGVASSEARDYFRLLVDDGRWLWVYRQLGDGKWFVHGEWT